MGLELDKYGEDYVLTGNSAWVTVGGISVYIKKTDEGVVVDLYERNSEMEDPLGSTYAFNNELEETVSCTE